MRARQLAVPVLALWLAGCPLFDFGKEEDDKDATSDIAAANALTNAASFTGGELVAGLMPDTTLPDVTLVGEDASAAPGSVTLLSFDAVNPDQDSDPIMATLIQFEGSEQHFEVLIDEPTVDAENVSFELELKLAKDVCSELCNKVFTIDVEHALKTESGGIGEHGEMTLSLDCTDEGDPDLCGSGGSNGSQTGGNGTDDGTRPVDGEPMGGGDAMLPDGGVTGGFAGGTSVAPSLIAFELMRSIEADLNGKCATDEFTWLTSSIEFCAQTAVGANLSAYASYEPCVNQYYEDQLKCVAEAPDCNAARECDYAAQDTSEFRHVATCGQPPGSIQAEYDRCLATGGGAGGAPGGVSGSGSDPGSLDAGVAIEEGCDPVVCVRPVDGMICDCKTNCVTNVGGIPMTTGLVLDCKDGTCTCMTGDLVGNTFSYDTCSADPAVLEWDMCGFPKLP